MPDTPPASTPRRAFYKVEGLGNDFVLLDHRQGGLAPCPAEVRWLCDRHRGVGADGVIEVLSTPEGTPWMRLHNADGGLARMCGNGLRCVARFLERVGAAPLHVAFAIHTDSGPRRATLRSDGQIAIEMGAAAGGGQVKCVLPEGPLTGHKVDVGNPHWVHVAEADSEAHRRAGPLEQAGPVMQRHAAFPEGVNVSVVRPLGPDAYALAVWERGVGPTQACGSAACATAASLWWAAGFNGDDAPALTIHLPGGPLRLEGGPSAILMVGDARIAFEGVVEARTQA